MLINTAAVDRPNGSMVRYGAMVREALERFAGEEVSVEMVDLSPPQAWLDRFPRSLREPVRYLGIAANARRFLSNRRDGVLHLLDGGHAYLFGGVRRHVAPWVVTIHDLIPALCLRGELPGPRPGRGAEWIIHRTLSNLARADAWVADSHNTRNDVIRLAGAPADRVQVVHPAVAVSEAPADAGRLESNSAPYVLHVAGNNNFYKNRVGVVDAFAAIRREEPATLTFVGAPPDAALREKIASSGVGEAIEFRCNVSEDELASLYRGAAFLLFPSTYEGFGWPPLEAMARGCPVVCSNAGSLAEIAGDAALVAPSGDIAALAAHGLRLLRDAALRERMVAAGFRHVRRFSMVALAKGLVEAYRKAAAAFAATAPGGAV
jgi:glycosyltransferase involved in cell wall biosynthesis